ncbi:MAG: hypothetical protein U0228_05550 [Myxococcaceae bacterium]
MLRWLPALVVAVVLSGCADVCTRAQTISDDWSKRHSACFPSGTLPNAPFESTACAAAMKPCSKADEQVVQRYLDCLEQLPKCTSDTRTSFNDEFLHCASGMSQVTPGCFAM